MKYLRTNIKISKKMFQGFETSILAVKELFIENLRKFINAEILKYSGFLRKMENFVSVRKNEI
jgi:hypothetical protein